MLPAAEQKRIDQEILRQGLTEYFRLLLERGYPVPLTFQANSMESSYCRTRELT